MDKKTLELIAKDPMWILVVLAKREGELVLTKRQSAVLVLLKYAESDRDRTVRALAKALEVSKPVITRALNTLQHFKLILRLKDDNDRRNVIVAITESGIQRATL